MATRRNKRRQGRGGNPLRRRLENCIKELVVTLACSNRYAHWNNFPEQLQSRFAIAFRQTQNIDEAISRCTTDMLNQEFMQQALASEHPEIVTNSIVEWFGIRAYYYLSHAEQIRLMNQLYHCINPHRQLTNTMHLVNSRVETDRGVAADANASPAVRNAAHQRAQTLNNAFTPDVVQDLASYLPNSSQFV